MKKDWTYKKLGEVCKGEASNIALNKISDNIGEYPLYGASGLAKHIDFYKQDVEYIGIVKDGAGVGRVGLYPAKSSLVGTMQYIIPSSEVKLRYLFYVLKGLNLANLVSGATIPHIYFKDYSKITIPVPPISIQESIVRELDAIHGILEKKQEQLRELDNLAQSLFYQMFGDPITNPMGWEIKKLGEVSSLLNGRAYQQKELLDQGKYRVLRVGNFFTNNTWYYSDLELPEDKYCDKGDLLFTWSASFGAHIWNGDKVIYHYHIWKIVLDEMYVDKLFYLHLLNNMVKSMMHDTHGTGMLHLTKSGMEMYDLPLPPLSLQQSFAAKVSAIEAQKQAVQQSIREIEALLAERMDNYFG